MFKICFNNNFHKFHAYVSNTIKIYVYLWFKHTQEFQHLGYVVAVITHVGSDPTSGHFKAYSKSAGCLLYTVHSDDCFYTVMKKEHFESNHSTLTQKTCKW